jgi:hypothetical protein
MPEATRHVQEVTRPEHNFHARFSSIEVKCVGLWIDAVVQRYAEIRVGDSGVIDPPVFIPFHLDIKFVMRVDMWIDVRVAGRKVGIDVHAAFDASAQIPLQDSRHVKDAIIMALNEVHNQGNSPLTNSDHLIIKAWLVPIEEDLRGDRPELDSHSHFFMPPLDRRHEPQAIVNVRGGIKPFVVVAIVPTDVKRPLPPVIVKKLVDRDRVQQRGKITIKRNHLINSWP